MDDENEKSPRSQLQAQPLILMRQPTDEEEPQDASRDSLRSATPIITPAMTDSHRLAAGTRSDAREASTPVVVPSQGPEKLVPRAPTAVEDLKGEGGTAADRPESKCHHGFSRERRQTRSVRMAERESSRYRQSKKMWAVVVGDFQGIYGDEMTLKAGEKVEIVSKDVRVSRNIGWWTGRSEKGKYGIFPAACVKVLTKEGENEEVNIEVEYPFIISCSDIQLREAIGVGGFGRVHRAIYKEHDVAVKVAKSTTFDLVKAAQDVITEARKFAHLAHVNVCALIGVVLVRDVCLVMEYAQGGALSEVLHKKKLSLPLDVILDWSQQIASGMDYLHNEIQPSLIHRDLKSGNILLAQCITPSSLHNNIIKITDFGLAREIEHTTQMTGAGTYPWMAPEVIISNDFSKKCDIWSYGVVLWELLTGEKPYGNLNAFVVAYGVGRGTLSLPIPEGCPKSFQKLMSACWKKEYSERPSFTEVLWQLKDIEREEFMTSTSLDEFLSIQSTWKSEIQEQFLKFKREESAFRDHELPGDITKRIKQQEEKICQQQQELEKLRTETKVAQEEWQKRRASEQEEVFRQQGEELEKLKEKLKEMETKKTEDIGHQPQNRPPRVKRFSAKRLLRWLSGSDTQKPAHPKDQRRPNMSSNPRTHDSTHPTASLPADRVSPVPLGPRRTTSFPSTSDPRQISMDARRPASVAAESSSTAVSVDKETHTSLPRGYGLESGHKRRHSGGNIPSAQVEGFAQRRPSSPSPPPSFNARLGSHVRPFTEGIQKLIDQEVPVSRVRSLSHPRSPSPHLSLVSSPRSPQASSTSSAAHSQSASVASEFGPIRKPSNLMLQNKHISSDDSNPSSPMYNPTYDSGKDSNTGSDFSNLSVTSDLQQQHGHQLITFDSPTDSRATFNIGLAHFDPLLQISTNETLRQAPFRESLRQTPSFDSLLMDPRGGTTSGNVSPNIFSTSPNLRRQTSPKSSLGIEQQQQLHMARNSPIARPRPRPAKLPSYTSDTSFTGSGHRPFSPPRHHRRSDISPSGSVRSLIIPSGTGYDSDYGMSGFQSDSDATSTHSSLLDLPRYAEAEEDLQPPLMPTPASLDTVHFDFDIPRFL